MEVCRGEAEELRNLRLTSSMIVVNNICCGGNP